MSTGKAERAGVTAVVDYLDKVDKFEPIISYSDKAPIIDGYFNIYTNERQKVEDFFAQIPVQVKGTSSDKDHCYRIGREHIEAYKQLGGIVFFKVIVNSNPPTLLYAILSLDRIDELQKQSTKEIRIDLNEVPTDPKTFETEIFAFASKRNEEKTEPASPKEIADLVNGFEEIREFLGEIADNEAKYDLESILDSIRNTRDVGTIGWRDKFIYYSRKALDLATNNLKGHDFAILQHDFGLYLHKQKQYHLVEDYFLKALTEFRKRDDITNVATALNNLGNLHRDLNRYKEAEQEYLEALKIRRELAKKNPNVYIRGVAGTLNNLGDLHRVLTRYKEAEQEYLEALKIYRELAKTNHDAYIEYVALTLNNLAILHRTLLYYNVAEEEFKEALKIRRKLAVTNPDAYNGKVANTLNTLASLHNKLNRYKEAEQESQEALDIFRQFAATNPDAYIGDVAKSLNNLAILHSSLNRHEEAEKEWKEALRIYRKLALNNPDAYNNDVAGILYNLGILHNNLTHYEEAEQEYQEALEIRKKLALTNPDVFNGYVAQTLNNLANLHYSLTRYEEAEKEYREAIEIRRELARKYPDAFIGDVAMTLENLAFLLQKDEKRHDEAKAAANEALDIYKELAKKYPQIWSKDVEDTQELLNCINQIPTPSASTKIKIDDRI